jgi:pimeloyl-ACP methyl ester carboxylesterase
MSSKPTLVLVHGAWHSPSHFAALTRYLESNGYTVEAPYLPSMHADDITKITMTEDIAAVRTCLLKALESADVLIVSHSYGTLPSSGALQGLDTASRTSDGHSTYVTGFCIIAGLLVPPGHSVASYYGDTPAPPQDLRGPILYPKDPPGPGYLFYHDIPFDEAVEAIKTLKPQAWAVNATVLDHAGHLVVPTRYMVCEKDNVLPPFMQRLMIDTARKGLGERLKIEAVTIESSHSPFLSRTVVVGEWLRKCAGEQEVKLEELGSY